MLALATPRLCLREAQPSDAGFLLALLNDADFIRYIGDRQVRTSTQAEDYIAQRLRRSYAEHGFGLLVVELRDAMPIGLCGLVQRDYLPDADLGFAFLPGYRSQGLAHEAARAVMQFGFDTLRMRRLAAIVQPDNAASLRLLHKLGFALDRPFKLTADEPELLILAHSR